MFEAAKVDGANEWQIYSKICMPLCKSGLFSITVGKATADAVFKVQIRGGQILHEDRAAGTVGDRMEKLDGESVFVVQNAYAAL